MNWREFKTATGGKKVEKVEKPTTPSPLSTFSTLNPTERISENYQQGATPADLQRLIGESLAEIDRQGRPWTGFHGALIPADRQQLRDAEAAIDQAALANDHAGLTLALDSYRDLLAELRRRLH